MSNRGERYNASGYIDMTAYTAIKRVAAEERKNRTSRPAPHHKPERKVYMCIYRKREHKEV